MPGFDGTGPRGQGAMTGRGLGPCNKNGTMQENLGYRPRLGLGLGRGYGAGAGVGRGMGYGRGRGGRRGGRRW